MGGLPESVIISAISVYLGVFFSGFFNSITRDIILPLISPVISEDGIAKFVVKVGGVKLNVGDVAVQVINLLIAIAIIYFLLPHLKEYVPIAGRR
jgi:large-conductance mechanosensitive channel